MKKINIKNLFLYSYRSFSTGEIIKLKNADELKSIISKSEVPVMVDFYADWCGPCKSLTPKLEEATKEKNFKLVKVNVDDHGEVAEEYDVSGIPHVLLFKNGKKESEFVGNNLDALTKMKSLI